MNLKNAIVDKIETTKDRGLKIVLYTRELDPLQMWELLMNVNNEVLSIDIPDEKEEIKSKSQRLKSTLI